VYGEFFHDETFYDRISYTNICRVWLHKAAGGSHHLGFWHSALRSIIKALNDSNFNQTMISAPCLSFLLISLYFTEAGSYRILVSEKDANGLSVLCQNSLYFHMLRCHDASQ
jgi:hypothetical protein